MLGKYSRRGTGAAKAALGDSRQPHAVGGTRAIRRRSAVVALIAISALASIGLVACGGSGSDDSSLTVAIASGTTDYGPIWIAEANGLFKKNGVDVKLLTDTESGTASLISSGKADVALFTSAFPISLAKNGKKAKIIYTMSSNAVPALVSSPKIQTLDQLRELSSCNMNSPVKGSIFYAMAVKMVAYYKLPCSITPLSAVTSQVPAVSSGQADAAATIYSVAFPAVDAKKVNLLVNPLKMSSKDQKGLGADTYPALVAFGIDSNLSDKKDAVVKFIKALRTAGETIGSSSAADLAQLTVTKLKADFPGITEASAQASWEASKLVVPSDNKRGYISEAIWKTALAGYATWGLDNFDSGQSIYSYKNLVDMSYYDSATS